MELSQGEKLILLMLCEIQEHLKIKGETNTSLIKEAIYSGNLWGLEWGMSGVFHNHETPRSVVEETVDILAMWERLEQSYDALSSADKTLLSERLEPLGPTVRFPGFDGNNESSYINATSFLIDYLDRFQHFKGRRDFNAHMPTLDAHRRMLAVFNPILYNVVLNGNFDVNQIAQVISERIHPEHRKNV